MEKMQRKRKEAIDGANMANLSLYAKNLDSAIAKTRRDIIAQAKRFKNNTFASVNGFVAEEVHIGAFNIDSAIKRSPLKAVEERFGNHGDYKILEAGKVIASGEFKHYNVAHQTQNAMRGYGSRDLIGPKDQIEEIKKIAKKRFLKNSHTRPHVAKEHKTVLQKVTDRIKVKGVQSRPKTLKETKQITKKALKGKVEIKEVMPDLSESVRASFKSGAIEGAKSGTAIGGGVSLIYNSYLVGKGKKEIKEAAKDVLIDTAISAADSTIKNAVGSAAKTASIHLAEKVGSSAAKSLLKSSAPVIVAVSMVEVAKDLYKYANGEMDGKQVAKNAVKTTATSAGGWAGAEAGALLGAAFGPAGALIGGLIGGIVGSIGSSHLIENVW